MGINIHIDDVSNEDPQTLIDVAVFLQVAAQRRDKSKEQPMGGSVQVVMPPVPTPPVPPVPPIPTMLEPTPAPTPHVAAGTDLDARGFPWDSRIHSAKRSKNGDGTWRYRRGVGEDVIKPVEEELRGVMGMTSEAMTEAADVAQAMGDAVEIMPQEAEPVVAAVPTPPAPPSDEPPAPPSDEPNVGSGEGEPTEGSFNYMAGIASKAIANNTLTADQVATILAEVGEANDCTLPHLGALYTRQDLIGAVTERLQAAIAGVGAV